MSDGPDDLDDHLATLVRLRATGADIYDRALQAARVAVARVLLAEAERFAGISRRRPEGTVVPFRRQSAEMPGSRDKGQ